MAYDLKKESDVKEYIDKLGVEYRFGCYSEKKPEGRQNQRLRDFFTIHIGLTARITFAFNLGFCFAIFFAKNKNSISLFNFLLF